MNKKEIVKKLVNQNINKKEKEALISLLIDNPLTVDIDKEEKNARASP